MHTRHFSSNNSNRKACPFETLGLQRGATVAEIKAAFNRRAKETHPDTNANTTAHKSDAEFVRVRAAFEEALAFAKHGRPPLDDAHQSPAAASDQHWHHRRHEYYTSSTSSDFISAAKALSSCAALSIALSASVLWMHWDTKQRTGAIAVVQYRRPDK